MTFEFERIDIVAVTRLFVTSRRYDASVDRLEAVFRSVCIHEAFFMLVNYTQVQGHRRSVRARESISGTFDNRRCRTGEFV